MTEPMRAWTAETLIDAYGDELLRLCLLYLGDRQLAEDAFQETMVKAWRALPGFRGESGAKTWLFHIAVNTCRDMLRSGWMRMRRRSVPLEVMPELADDSEIEIRPDEIEMQACRSSGAGGQHINKTSSAVRLTHLPTGIVVFCQTERSQFQNRDNAMKMLKAKLAELKLQQHAEKISDIKGVQMKIEWGSQIRSYVFMPYTLAKDTRTGYEMGNIQAVMDGDIDGFINAYLTAAANGELK